MSTITPVHQWTNGGDRVLLVRFVDSSHQSYGGFQWPKEVGAVVTEPDWNSKPVCGHGLHGWPWGTGLGDGKAPIFTDANWQVVSAKAEDIVLIDGGSKVKARQVRLEYVGSWWAALAFVESGKIAWIQHAARGAASATGARGAASATGWSGAASATGARGAASATGARGAASATGESGAASATGWSGAASATGWSGAASATGWSGAASATGARGAASATGASGAASATGASGAASATGARGAAVTSGEYSTVECGPTGLAVSTADEVTWIARPGAIFVHRWASNGGGCKVASFKGMKAIDGERITFNCGAIIRRVKP